MNRSLNIKNLLSLFSLVKLIVSMCISLCNRSASSPRQQLFDTEFIDIKAPRLDACGVFGAEEAHFIFRVHGVLVDLVSCCISLMILLIVVITKTFMALLISSFFIIDACLGSALFEV